MFTKVLKKDLLASWKKEICVFKIWNKEKNRPTFWILFILIPITILLALPDRENIDPWLGQLEDRGWLPIEEICPDLPIGKFAALAGVEIYHSLSGVTLAKTQPATDEEKCEPIATPTFVEEL